MGPGHTRAEPVPGVAGPVRAKASQFPTLLSSPRANAFEFRDSESIDCRAHVENLPSTSGSAVVAWLPVIVVLSMTAVPMMATPPPIPTREMSIAPLFPGVAWPARPCGVPEGHWGHWGATHISLAP